MNEFLKVVKAFTKEKTILLPALLQVILPLLILLSILQITGTTEVVYEYKEHALAYEIIKSEESLDPYKTTATSFKSYLESKGYYVKVQSLFTLKNFYYWGMGIILIFLTLSFCTADLYAHIEALGKKKNKKTLKRVKEFFFELLELRTMALFVIGLPITIAIVLIGIFSLIKLYSVKISFFFIGMIILMYGLVSFLRLMFAPSIMFTDHASSITSIKKSIHIAEKHIVQVTAIAFVALGVMVASVAQLSPLGIAFFGFYSNPSIIGKIVSLLFMVGFIVIEAMLFSTEQLFLFHSYKELKK